MAVESTTAAPKLVFPASFATNEIAMHVVQTAIAKAESDFIRGIGDATTGALAYVLSIFEAFLEALRHDRLSHGGIGVGDLANETTAFFESLVALAHWQKVPKAYGLSTFRQTAYNALQKNQEWRLHNQVVELGPFIEPASDARPHGEPVTIGETTTVPGASPSAAHSHSAESDLVRDSRERKNAARIIAALAVMSPIDLADRETVSKIQMRLQTMNLPVGDSTIRKWVDLAAESSGAPRKRRNK